MGSGFGAPGICAMGAQKRRGPRSEAGGKAVGVKGFVTWFRDVVLPLLGFGPLWKNDPTAPPLVPPSLKKQTSDLPRTRSAVEFDVLNARRGLMDRQTSLTAYAKRRKQFAEAIKEREEKRNESE
jgi:hypothetical protein